MRWYLITKGDGGMLTDELNDLYGKLRLYFYMQMAPNFANREASLTTSETFCMEVINLLGNPTVSEFASVTGISGPNAASKLASLIRKGYVEKVRSDEDKRTYHLHPTEKFYRYYRISTDYLNKVVERCQKRFSKQELANLEEFIRIIDDELMPEVNIENLKKNSQKEKDSEAAKPESETAK
jgi:DNA-binding MarR family transcriptional regulator